MLIEWYRDEDLFTLEDSPRRSPMLRFNHQRGSPLGYIIFFFFFFWGGGGGVSAFSFYAEDRPELTKLFPASRCT